MNKFKNLLLILAIPSFVILIISSSYHAYDYFINFIKSVCDILNVSSILIIDFLYAIIDNEYVLCTVGIIISYCTMYKKMMIPVFKHHTVVIGSILMKILLSISLMRIIDKIIFVQIAMIIIFVCITIYHHNYVMGLISSIMLFDLLGFNIECSLYGYRFGFHTIDALMTAYRGSLILSAVFIMVRTMDMELYKRHFQIFEVGVLFYGVLIGNISVLIMSSRTFMFLYDYHNFSNWILIQLGIVAYYIIIMYYGYKFNMSKLKGLSCTFMVLYGLKLSFMVIHIYGHVWLVSLILTIFILCIWKYVDIKQKK